MIKRQQNIKGIITYLLGGMPNNKLEPGTDNSNCLNLKTSESFAKAEEA